MSLASLQISLDPEGASPLYQQLAQQLRNMIQQQRLKPGAPLPSSRKLAEETGLSRSSVTRTYDDLLAEGFLVAYPRRGICVANDIEHLYPQTQIHSDAFAPPPETKMEAVLDSTADLSQFPYRQWAACQRRSWLRPDPQVLEGNYGTGLPALKSAIADYLQQMRALPCRPEQIVITSGNRDAMQLIITTLLTDGGMVWLENPCYPRLFSVVNSMTERLEPLSVDEQGACVPDISVSDLPLSTLGILTPGKQYPLNVTMSPLRRQQWQSFQAEVASAGKHLWLVEDDYDNEFVYGGRSLLPLMSQTPSTLFVGSFSKVLFRGLRLGFILLPEYLVDKFARIQTSLGMSASLAAQPALADFMGRGEFATHLRRCRRMYRQKRDDFHQLMRDNDLERWFDWQKPNRGMHLVARFRQCDQDAEEPIRSAFARRGVHLSGLSQHYFCEPQQTGLVLGFSKPSYEQMQQALQHLAQACRQHLNTATKANS